MPCVAGEGEEEEGGLSRFKLDIPEVQSLLGLERLDAESVQELLGLAGVLVDAPAHAAQLDEPAQRLLTSLQVCLIYDRM